MDPSLIRLKLKLHVLIKNKKNQKETKQNVKLLETAQRRAQKRPRHVAPGTDYSTGSYVVSRTDLEPYCNFYSNCLISRALIGSFLSSIRVQTDKILIYASF